MNTKYIFATAFAAITTIVTAQTSTSRIELGTPNDVALSIPKEFSYNNIPMLTLYDNSEQHNILVYNEDLEQVRQISIANNKTFDYRLTYKDEIRTITAINEESKTESNSSYSSYEDFIRHNKILDPSFDESQLIITTTENGDSIISFDYSRTNYTSNSEMYFHYETFATQYPRLYYLCSNGTLTKYQVAYGISYSDWTDNGTHTETLHKELSRIKLCNVNLNNGDGRASSYFETCQTLFNNDEDFEYIIPKLKVSNNGTIISGDYYTFTEDTFSDEKIETNRTTLISEPNKLALDGFQIVSSSGTILNDITFENEFEGSLDLGYAYVITIGSKTYLAFDGYNSENKSSTVFYKIEKDATSITRVAAKDARMILSPTILERSTPVNVTFTDENVGGSTLKVISSSGSLIKSVDVPEGKKSIQIDVNGQSGMYLINRTQKNNNAETRKIIVK